MFRFSLDKSSKKFICPKCQKKTFVRYIDNTSNDYTESHFGRCDRESNCKHHSIPKNGKLTFTIEPVCFNEKIKSTININEIAIHGRNFKNNNFIQFLKMHFSVDEIKNTILKYCIGTSNYWHGATIFWQINENEEVLTGKIMLFDIETGKRIKKPFNHINWMHKALKIKDFNLQQCLFGLHLIKEYKGQTIAIVESEKTAIIMSMFLPNYLWLATGSKGNFKLELLKPLKQYQILAFPDKSEYQDWSEKARQLYNFGFKIKCSSIIERKEVEKGYDLADYYIDYKLKKTNLVKESNYSETEILVNNLAKKNPEIINLIKTFDLVDKYHNDIINFD